MRVVALKVNEDAHRDLSLVNAALDAIIEEASILLRDMEKDLKEAALRETGIQEMRMGMEEVKKQISVSL